MAVTLPKINDFGVRSKEFGAGAGFDLGPFTKGLCQHYGGTTCSGVPAMAEPT